MSFSTAILLLTFILLVMWAFLSYFNVELKGSTANSLKFIGLVLVPLSLVLKGAHALEVTLQNWAPLMPAVSRSLVSDALSVCLLYGYSVLLILIMERYATVWFRRTRLIRRLSGSDILTYIKTAVDTPHSVDIASTSSIYFVARDVCYLIEGNKAMPNLTRKDLIRISRFAEIHVHKEYLKLADLTTDGSWLSAAITQISRKIKAISLFDEPSPKLLDELELSPLDAKEFFTQILLTRPVLSGQKAFEGLYDNGMHITCEEFNVKPYGLIKLWTLR